MKADRAGILQQTELGHLAAEEPLGQGRRRIDAHLRLVAGAPGDEIDQRDVVDHRVGVRHGDDGRDPAGCRRLSGRGEGLAMLGAGLADEDAHVDEAGRHDRALAVDDLGSRRPRRLQPPRDPAATMRTVGDDDRADRIQIARGIDDAGIVEDDRTLGAAVLGGEHHGLRPMAAKARSAR